MKLTVTARFRLSCALLYALLFACSVAVAEEAARAPTIWTSKQAGIRLDLPRTWAMQSLPGMPPLILREARGRAVMGVMVVPLADQDAPADLNALTDKSLAAHRKSIGRFKLLSRNDLSVAGAPATEIYFKGKTSGESYKWIQTLFVSRGYKVSVLYSAPAKLYLRYLGDYDQLVRSIRLLP